MISLNRTGFSFNRFCITSTLFVYILFPLLEPGCTQKKATSLIPEEVTASSKIRDLFNADSLWKAPDTLSIPHNDTGKMIAYGRLLIMHTSVYFGPHGSIGRFTNGMNCQNCHLAAGTKPFGNNFSKVASTYPKFKPRSGINESISKKISDCFERSLNGKSPDTSSAEMKAMVAYINWLGQRVRENESPMGSGLLEIPFLVRAADPETGKSIFNRKCVTCHGYDGQGKMNPDDKSYQYPPLWGEHSYNIGASLYRLTKFAGFVRTNMPFITTDSNPPLTNQEAWDVAAYVNSMPRPEMDLSRDWPDISTKPFDYPFGPYTDPFDEQQHKYGHIQAYFQGRRKSEA